MPIKVMLIEDSAVTRAMLGEILGAAPDIVLTGSVASLEGADETLRRAKPDVLLLDAELPHMSSLDFLGRLMRLRPMPVVVISSVTPAGFEATMGALELGAVDYVARGAHEGGTYGLASEVCGKIRTAYGVRVRALSGVPPQPPAVFRCGGGAVLSTLRDDRLILLGAGVGGTEALRSILTALPPDMPGILAALPMPGPYSASFARRLDTVCAIRVKQAEAGEPVLAGHAYLAPGEMNMQVVREGGGYAIALDRDEPAHGVRPSLDALFSSAAAVCKGPTVGVVLTGNGGDGARGLLELRRAGAHTLAQDHATSIAFAMPRAAMACGAAHEMVGLRDIPGRLLALLNHERERLLNAM